MELILDVEANNLLPFCTEIHVVVIRELDTGRFKACRTREQLSRFIGKATKIIGHNLLGYDLEVIKRTWEIDYSVGPDTWGGSPVEFVDTLHLSQFLNPDRIGGHSLDNLAKWAGSYKQEYDGGFEVWTQEMEDYCVQDTAATGAVYKKLLSEFGRSYGDG